MEASVNAIVALLAARAHGGDITLRTDSDGTVQFSLLLPSPASNMHC
jgi:signal transduction histidine kinase